MGAFLTFLIFLKISGLCQKHTLPQNLLEKLGEVFRNNFLTAMLDLKRRIKAGTAKNRCHTISERSLSISVVSLLYFSAHLFIVALWSPVGSGVALDCFDSKSLPIFILLIYKYCQIG